MPFSNSLFLQRMGNCKSSSARTAVSLPAAVTVPPTDVSTAQASETVQTSSGAQSNATQSNAEITSATNTAATPAVHPVGQTGASQQTSTQQPVVLNIESKAVPLSKARWLFATAEFQPHVPALWEVRLHRVSALTCVTPLGVFERGSCFA